jgi:hypothetical protein
MAADFGVKQLVMTFPETRDWQSGLHGKQRCPFNINKVFVCISAHYFDILVFATRNNVFI